MNSGQLEKTGSLRKRTLSRGMSEDESLRHIIREAEQTERQLTRSDSRYGSLRRGQTNSLSEDDPLSENMEMVELRVNYEQCVQELRTLALQQEALLFQVDCLQDALEGTEEMLVEAQKDTQRSAAELERERHARRRLELELSSLQQEMERLQEERRAEQLQWGHTGPVWLQGAPEGTSVDREEISRSVFSSQKQDAQAGEDHDESSGYEDAPSEFSPGPSTPDRDLLEPEGDDESHPSIPKHGDSCALS